VSRKNKIYIYAYFYYYSENKAQENVIITTITSYKHDAYKEIRNGYYTH
jgi:hypothetical protein